MAQTKQNIIGKFYLSFNLMYGKMYCNSIGDWDCKLNKRVIPFKHP